jgi:hypothetical protein
MNFRDERYLPFEYLGAVCRCRIELPRENNYHDPDTLADAILCFYYMAREGANRCDARPTKAQSGICRAMAGASSM